jgi:hypothetical protein
LPENPHVLWRLPSFDGDLLERFAPMARAQTRNGQKAIDKADEQLPSEPSIGLRQRCERRPSPVHPVLAHTMQNPRSGAILPYGQLRLMVAGAA